MATEVKETDLRRRVPADAIRPCRGAHCVAEIVILQTPNGATMPTDPLPDMESGRVVLMADGRARVLKKAERLAAQRAGVPLYNSHFATCPDGPAFRSRSRR